MKIRNVELPDLDLMDADVAKKFEQAISAAADEVKGLRSDTSKSRSDGIRAICKSIFKCFNTLFGEGTDKKIFGEACNMRECLLAFGELAAIREQQDAEFKELFSESAT